MGKDDRLKSAYELAMERLRADDREMGVDAQRPLTDAQKARIAEVRRTGKAKLAELEILHRKNLREAGGDPAQLSEIEEHYRIDRRRVETSTDDAVQRIKRSG